MRYLRWISLLTILALLCAMVPASLAEDIAVDIEEEVFAEETVEEVDSLDLSALMFEDEVSTPENNDLDLLDVDQYETETEEQVSPAVAANANSDFEIDEDGVLVEYTGFDKIVTIPSSVKEIGEDAFYSCNMLESVVIPNSVTSIKSYAFSYCDKLESITIPSSVTSIERSAFNQSDNFVFRGTAGSYAEKYANSMSIPFNAPIVTFDESIDTNEEGEPYEDITVFINQTRTIKAIQRPSDLATTLKWSSSNTKVATIDQNGKVKAIAKGTTTITAATADGKGKAAKINVYVPESTYIEFDFDSYNEGIELGHSVKLTAYTEIVDGYDFDNDFPVTWSTSDKSIVSIESTKKDGDYNYTAVLKGNKVGKATITASTSDGGKETISIEVYRPEPESVTIDQKGPITLKVGKQYTLSASVLPAKASQKVTWYSDDTDIATVSKTGVVTAKGEGNTRIYVETDNYCEDYITIKVQPLHPHPTKIKIDQKGPSPLKSGKKPLSPRP